MEKKAFVCVKQASHQSEPCERSGGERRIWSNLQPGFDISERSKRRDPDYGTVSREASQSHWKASEFQSCSRVVPPLAKMSCLGVHPALSPYVGEPSGGLPLCQHSGESQEVLRRNLQISHSLWIRPPVNQDGGNIYTVTTGCVIAAMVTKMQLHYSFYEPPMTMIPYAIIETHTHTWSDLPSMTMTPNKQYLSYIYIYNVLKQTAENLTFSTF